MHTLPQDAPESTARFEAATGVGLPNAYWSCQPTKLLARLGTSSDGITQEEAKARLRQYGANDLSAGVALSRARVLWTQLQNPLLLLLVFAALASALTGEWVDTGIVLTIVIASLLIGYFQEYRAAKAALALAERVHARATVLRDGAAVSLPFKSVVPGDVVTLAAGSLVPADCVLLEARDLFVSEAALTGESFPVEKQLGPNPVAAGLGQRSQCVFLGTNVRSGWAKALVVATGRRTQFGSIAQRLQLRPPESDFERGTRRFGYLLTLAMLCMVLVVFAAHVIRGRPPVETLLFAIALAVGLSPELLPAILSVNLARGAQRLAARGVLVRRLSAIENLGSMDVLCTDKTGTLTEGLVRLDGALGVDGSDSARVLELAGCNAALESGLASPLDDAILSVHPQATQALQKLGEIPFDFVRKRVSVVVAREGRAELITKGAFAKVLDVCTASADGKPLGEAERAALMQRFHALSAQGVRVLAVATRSMEFQPSFDRSDERELVLEGWLTFQDRAKVGVEAALTRLRSLGTQVKLITGDSGLVAAHLARDIGLPTRKVLTGRDLDELSDEALWRAAEQTDLFVEVDPNQKERIILSLKKMGHVVGFLGDGVNDAPAMHAADTGLSVEGAVDVAREAADFVLLRKDLGVIAEGIVEGRRTFANTLKYVLTTTSANLGNMVSMALASLFLPFLPLLASQILLNNFLSDLPAIGIATDNVDPEGLERPQRWSMRFIGRFMVEFGALSSAFDLITFALLLQVFRAPEGMFRTAWFVESLLTELAIALVVRTRRPAWKSRPGRMLLDTSLMLGALTLALPYVPAVEWLGLVPLPVPLLMTVLGITLLYVVAAELAKHWFYRPPIASTGARVP
jgi:Mg2+-importing ATPase